MLLRAPSRILVLGVCLLAWTPPAVFAQGPDLGAQGRRGEEAMAAGRYADAVAIYSELARLRPADAGIAMNLGMAQSMAGRPKAAIQTLTRVVKLQPGLHPAWLFLGLSHLDAGNARAAVHPLTRALDTDPRSTRARRALAGAYLTLERYESAERELRKLVEADPKDAASWFALGQAHEARARQAFDRLQRAFPQSAYELLVLGDVLVSQQRFDDAIASYREAAAKAPGLKGVAAAAAAEAFALAGRADEAAAETKTLEALPEPDCTQEKALCEFLSGNHAGTLAALAGRTDAESQYWRVRAHNELALDAFARLEALPASVESHDFRARLYRAQGRHLESVEELRRASVLAPSDPRIQRELATSLYLSRNYDDAEKLLEPLVTRDPQSAELNFLYGDTLLQAQKPDRAIGPLETAVKASPSDRSSRAALGRAYMQLGRAKEAIPHLKAALALDEDGSLHYQLARAYAATGQPLLAKQMLAKQAEIVRQK